MSNSRKLKKLRETTEENLEMKLVNHLMKDGKKKVAEKIFRNASIILRKKYEKDISHLLVEALVHGGPMMITRNRRRGSQKVKVPFPLTESQRLSMGLRWIVKESRRSKGPGKNPAEKLAEIIFETSKAEGGVVKMAKEVGKEVSRNRGNAFLRW